MSNCPNCQQPKFFTITSQGENFEGEKVVFCSKCQIAWLQNSSVRANGDYYQSNAFSEEFRGFTTPPPLEIKMREERADKRLGLLNSLNLLKDDGTDRVLEIGCSFGAFLKAVRNDKVANVKGIELSSSMVEFSHEYLQDGETIIREPLSKEIIQEYWPTIICIYQVIEHIEYIDDFMSVLSAVHEDTFIVVEFPDLEQALKNRKRLGKKYFQRSHLYDFCSYSLVNFFEKYGLYSQHVCYGSESGLGDKNTTIIFSKSRKQSSLSKPNMLLPLIFKSKVANHLIRLLGR